MPKLLEAEQAIKSPGDASAVKTVAAGEFKAKCLKLLDEVAATRELLVITKFGKPVAQVVPMPQRVELF